MKSALIPTFLILGCVHMPNVNVVSPNRSAISEVIEKEYEDSLDDYLLNAWDTEFMGQKRFYENFPRRSSIQDVFLNLSLENDLEFVTSSAKRDFSTSLFNYTLHSLCRERNYSLILEQLVGYENQILDQTATLDTLRAMYSLAISSPKQNCPMIEETGILYYVKGMNMTFDLNLDGTTSIESHGEEQKVLSEELEMPSLLVSALPLERFPERVARLQMYNGSIESKNLIHLTYFAVPTIVKSEIEDQIRRGQSVEIDDAHLQELETYPHFEIYDYGRVGFGFNSYILEDSKAPYDKICVSDGQTDLCHEIAFDFFDRNEVLKTGYVEEQDAKKKALDLLAMDYFLVRNFLSQYISIVNQINQAYQDPVHRSNHFETAKASDERTTILITQINEKRELYEEMLQRRFSGQAEIVLELPE